MELTIHHIRADIAVIGMLRRNPGLAPFSQLQQEWPRYGLRRSDLDRAVLRLESRGFVAVERLKGLQWLSLTSRGDRWAHSLRIWIERLHLLPRRIQHWFSKRSGAGETQAQRRRLVDRLGRALDGV